MWRCYKSQAANSPTIVCMNFFNRKKIDDDLWNKMFEKTRRLLQSGAMDLAEESAYELYEYSKTHGANQGGKLCERTINALNNIGYVHILKNEYGKAEYYLLDALQNCEEVYGKYSREVALVCMNLSKMYAARAKYVADRIDRCERVKKNIGSRDATIPVPS